MNSRTRPDRPASADLQAVAEDVDLLLDLDAQNNDDGRSPESVRGTGTVLGVPYDLRRPTAERLKATWWDPTSEKVVVPRAFGAGWAVNFGALAVKAGAIEPDAEDVPFASTPDAAFRAAAVGPAVLAAAVVAHYAVRGRSLPEMLPNHWNLVGEVDGTVSKPVATVIDIVTATAGAGLAALGAFGARDHGTRTGLVAAGAGTAATAAMITVGRVAAPGKAPWFGPSLLAGLGGAAGATLLGLARAGRRAEQRRDLG
jgi:hypothetical protein